MIAIRPKRHFQFMPVVDDQARWNPGNHLRTKGKIKSWHDDKGYGFITPFDGDSQVFIHIRAFRNRSRRPAVDDVVTYDVSRDRQGRLQAANATLAGDGLAGRDRASKSPAAMAAVIAALFLGAVTVSVISGGLPVQVLVGYLVLSAITFVVYASDKSAAQRGRWRTREGTLHFLALAGGWPGALIARQALRHKSRKKEFRAVFRATVLLNCGVLFWLHTAPGRALLGEFLGTRFP